MGDRIIGALVTAVLLSGVGTAWAGVRPAAAPRDLVDIAVVGARIVTLETSGLLEVVDLETGRRLASLQMPRPVPEYEFYRMVAVRGTDDVLVGAGQQAYRCDVGARPLALKPLPRPMFLFGPQSAVRGRALCGPLREPGWQNRPTLVDTTTGAELRVCEACRDWGYARHGRLIANAAALSDDGAWFAEEKMHTLFTWDIADDRARVQVAVTDFPGQLAVGGGVVARCAAQHLTLYDAGSGAVRWKWSSGPGTWCRSPELSPDGRRIACLVLPDAEDQRFGPWTLEVRDTATGAEARTIALDSPGWSVRWSPDNERLVASTRDGRVLAWDTATWAMLPWSRAGMR